LEYFFQEILLNNNNIQKNDEKTIRQQVYCNYKFFFLHIKVYKTTTRSQEYLPENIKAAFDSRSLHQSSVSSDKSGSGTKSSSVPSLFEIQGHKKTL
jgi:hypothetical protein